MLFWVNCIMNSNDKAWFCTCSESQLTIEDAMRMVKKYEKLFKDELICAWIESYPEKKEQEKDGKQKVVHWIKCYIDTFGNSKLKKNSKEDINGSAEEDKQRDEESD